MTDKPLEGGAFKIPYGLERLKNPLNWPSNIIVAAGTRDLERLRHTGSIFGGPLTPSVVDAHSVFSESWDDAFDDLTGFFRKQAAFEYLTQELKEMPKNARILSAPDSIGCQSVSLACLFKDAGLGALNPRIVPVDISSSKAEITNSHSYPVELVAGIDRQYKKYFDLHGDEARVRPEISDMIERATALDLISYDGTAQDGTKQSYEATVCLNLLGHLKEDDRRSMLQNFARYTTKLIMLDYGSTEADSPARRMALEVMEENGFRPCEDHERTLQQWNFEAFKPF